MIKNIAFLFLSSFCIFTLRAQDMQALKETPCEPQVFEINLDDSLDKLAISDSDMKKTRIMHRYVHNCAATLIKSTINLFWCEQLEISAACKEYSFEEDKNLDAFLSSMKTDKKYAEKFRNILPGVRYTIPYSVSSENARTSPIITCVFCPNVNNRKGEYQHAIFFDTENKALCGAIKAYNKTKNLAQ